MGDRKNPIQFGPEWMRNSPRERSAVLSVSTSQSATSNPANATVTRAARTSGGATANTSSTNTSNNTYSCTGAIPKVQLANLRYGKEEMLALYDRNSKAPSELKSIESIYQPRGKQPYALNNTFEGDLRDNIRSSMPVAGMVTGERYVPHRGPNRSGPSDGRSRSRGYSRSTSTGKVAWHTGGHRMSNYSGGHDEDGGPLRSWNNNNHHSRNSGEVSEGWPNKTYRSKRQSNTNWRQQRNEGNEWRLEPGRPRHSGDKWERDWEKSLSWNNRRTWGGGEMQNNEENLPEWAVENAECGGTFDSSGAFHGYSNDDSNLPKPDSTYPLTRSHTHTTISRFKNVEDGSDEWWASEKAKKLLPKRFDASDIKFKKPPPVIGVPETTNSATTSKENNNQASSNNEKSSQELDEKQNTASAPESPESNTTIQKEETYVGNNVYKNKFPESKTFDAMVRSNINMDDANDERGNFQSVIITPNNSLRQKHQHLVPANDITNKMQSLKIQKSSLSSNVQPDNEHSIHKTPEDILVNNVLEMVIDDKEILPTQSMKSGMASNLGSSINPLSQIQNPAMQMNMQTSVIQNNMLKIDGNINNQNMQISGIQPTGMQQSTMQQTGMQMPSMHQSGHQTSVGHTSVRLQPGKQPQGMSSNVLQASNKQSGLLNSITQSGVQNAGKQQSGMQNQGLLQIGSLTPSGMQPSGMPSSMQNRGMPTGVQNPGGMPSSMQNPGMPSNMQNPGMPSSMLNTRIPSGMINTGMPSSMQNIGMTLNCPGFCPRLPFNKQNLGLPSNMQNPAMPSNMQNTGMTSNMQNNNGMPSNMQNNNGMPSNIQNTGMPTNIQNTGMPTNMQNSGMPSNMQHRKLSTGSMQNSGMSSGGLQNQGMSATGLQTGRVQPPVQSSVIQPAEMAESALKASLGLPLHSGAIVALPIQDVHQALYPNPINIGGPRGASMQASNNNMPAFQSNSGVSGMNNANIGNNSLFLGHNSNNPSMPSPSDIPMPPNQSAQNMFPMHGIQHSGSQSSFGNLMYNNNLMNPADQWYYEDPKMDIQGPFSSKDMFNWYRAGFFTSSLMVRRACETVMRPLGSYGINVPFAQMDMIPMYTVYDNPTQGSHNTFMNSESNSELDVDLLWGQPSNDLMWMHNNRNETRVNNLSMFFWDQQPSAIASNSLLPEEIAKEMKTEDQILAQLRASQNTNQSPTLSFADQPEVTTTAPTKPDDRFAAAINATPNLEELHKLIQKEALTEKTDTTEPENTEAQAKTENSSKPELIATESTMTKHQNSSKTVTETKSTKQKTETDKATKIKDNNNSKNKSKKSKDEKKEEAVEVKVKESEAKADVTKQPQERSPSKNKKEDKSIKKELEREKKEWIKEGFTIVKGPEKTTAKDAKKKIEDSRVSEDADRKRKEAEKIVEDDKKKKQADAQKKPQEQQQIQQLQRQSESLIKKAPWSAIGDQTLQSLNREGPKLTEIQRLEREKKLEQMKEQQHMMHIIAQQQAAALAREQEVQAGLGWSKQKANLSEGQSLTEIQAEARKQAVSASVVAQISMNAQALEEAVAFPLSSTNVPWGGNLNGVGFWDTQPNQPPKSEKQQEATKPVEPAKNKKLVIPKKDTSPAAEFEAWCTSFLSPWSAKIDAPTFVAFLKDIESPYEVKDYVKCYLGESKESNDFARQFLERRSKLLRVGMVTPSDDLCSPAIAINPRSVLSTEYQEVKSKGKKSKKNKMLKVDARILGFSVTASEDRINVGDIDTV